MKYIIRHLLARNETTPAERAKSCPVCAESNRYNLGSALVYYQCHGCKSMIRVSKIKARPDDVIVVVAEVGFERLDTEFDAISLSVRKLLS